jgi:hypothetical protein
MVSDGASKNGIGMLRSSAHMRGHSWRRVALVLCLVLCGCSRFEVVQDPLAQTQELVGYQVRVTTTDGRVLKFALREVTESALVGDTRQVSLDKVAQLERWHFDIAKTALLFLGLAALYFAPMLWMSWM